jgi:hypothetical protein
VTPNPNNPLGAKGVGEAGTIGSIAALMNAVLDALAPLGVEHLDMPFTPARVWQAIRDAHGVATDGPRGSDGRRTVGSHEHRGGEPMPRRRSDKETRR